MSQLRISDWSSTVVQNDNLLPSQVEPRENNTRGCRLLVLRSFEQAREEYVKFHPSRRKGRNGAVRFREAEEWLESHDTFVFSFEWICAHFGWDAEWFRQKLREEAISEERQTMVVRQMHTGIGKNKITA